MIRILMISAMLFLASCSHSDDDNGILPGDGEDAVFSDAVAYTRSPGTVRENVCKTYALERLPSGQLGVTVNKPIWLYFSKATVRFSGGQFIPLVYTAKSMRLYSGRSSGFMWLRGQRWVEIRAPYSPMSISVEICPRT